MCCVFLNVLEKGDYYKKFYNFLGCGYRTMNKILITLLNCHWKLAIFKPGTLWPKYSALTISQPCHLSFFHSITANELVAIVVHYYRILSKRYAGLWSVGGWEAVGTDQLFVQEQTTSKQLVVLRPRVTTAHARVLAPGQSQPPRWSPATTGDIPSKGEVEYEYCWRSVVYGNGKCQGRGCHNIHWIFYCTTHTHPAQFRRRYASRSAGVRQPILDLFPPR